MRCAFALNSWTYHTSQPMFSVRFEKLDDQGPDHIQFRRAPFPCNAIFALCVTHFDRYLPALSHCNANIFSGRPSDTTLSRSSTESPVQILLVRDKNSRMTAGRSNLFACKLGRMVPEKLTISKQALDLMTRGQSKFPLSMSDKSSLKIIVVARTWRSLSHFRRCYT